MNRHFSITIPLTSASPRNSGINVESFNGKLRDELLNGEIFDTLYEAKVLIERWRREYNEFRPHSGASQRSSWLQLAETTQTVKLKMEVSTTSQIGLISKPEWLAGKLRRADHSKLFVDGARADG